MENQNLQQENLNPTLPASPVVQTPPIQTPPVSEIKKPKSKLPILIIGIIIFLLIAGSAAGFYVFKQQSLKTAAKPAPSPVVQKQTLTPTNTPTPIVFLTATSTPITTPTPNPTANWKTYNNSEFGFQFKYPNSWLIEIKEREPEYNDFIGIGGFISLHAPGFAESVYFNVSDNPNNLSIEKYVQDRMPGGFIPQYSTTSVNEIPAKKTSFPGQGGVDETIIFAKSTKIYSISLSGALSIKRDNFDQILSTFKFTQ